MIGLYRIINGDLFGIARRLKSLDKNYFVVYSYRENRYEVHNKGNKGNTYCFSAPALDERVIIKARKTARERIDKILKEMEEHNERLKAEAFAATRKKIEMGAENALSKEGKIEA